MKKSKVALIALLGAAVIVSGISIVAFTAADSGSGNSSRTAQLSDKSMAASVRTQIEKPLSLGKGEIADIQKTSEDPDHIALSWTPVEGAIGYNVYLCDRDESEDYVKIADVQQPSVDIGDLKDTSPYWIKVCAYINDGGSMYECPPAVIKTATQPADITDLDSTHSGEVLGFQWTPNPRCTGYDIYRGSSDDDYQFQLYKSIEGSSNEFEDSDVKEGVIYTYIIRPYRVVDDKKYDAAGKTIDLMSGLGSPDDLIAIRSDNGVVLSWKGRNQADGYNIFVSKGDTGEYELLDTAKTSPYTVNNMEKGVAYSFRVQPYSAINDKTAFGTWSTFNVTYDGASTAPDGSSVISSGTYVEISIAQQHLWFFVDGKLYLETDVVTGNDDGQSNTPTGNFKILEHNENAKLEGETYTTYVDYWMCFLGGGFGIHDASWRSYFGGDIYKGNGSHGCVNAPHDKAAEIYEHTDLNTPVFIY